MFMGPFSISTNNITAIIDNPWFQIGVSINITSLYIFISILFVEPFKPLSLYFVYILDLKVSLVIFLKTLVTFFVYILLLPLGTNLIG